MEVLKSLHNVILGRTSHTFFLLSEEYLRKCFQGFSIIFNGRNTKEKTAKGIPKNVWHYRFNETEFHIKKLFDLFTHTLTIKYKYLKGKYFHDIPKMCFVTLQICNVMKELYERILSAVLLYLF